MLITISGTYEHGTIHLDEPVSPDLAGQVLVTFLPRAGVPALATDSTTSVRPRFSFDESLALPVATGSTVSDAVSDEREEANW